MQTRGLTLTVNGEKRWVELPPNVTLLEALRDYLFCYDVKDGCEKGDCGACTVLLDGKPVNACLVLAWQAEGHEITTVSGLGTPENPHPLQRAFAEHGAVQCGFCIPGMILAAKGLLDENPHPTRAEIREGLSGNLCRCTGYQKIVEAVEAVATGMRYRAPVERHEE